MKCSLLFFGYYTKSQAAECGNSAFCVPRQAPPRLDWNG